MPFKISLCAAGSALLAMLTAGCGHLDSGDGASAPSAETIRGRLTYRQRQALPTGSVIHVGLVEVRGKTSESVVLAEQSFAASGQVPIPFALAYDPKAIDPARHYAVRARITDTGGRVFWATPRPVPVLTQGHPAEVEVLVAPAGSCQAAPPATFFFECDYGQVYYIFPAVSRETQESQERTRYVARIGAHQLEVTLEKGPCLDDMSGRGVRNERHGEAEQPQLPRMRQAPALTSTPRARGQSSRRPQRIRNLGENLRWDSPDLD